MRPRHSKAFSGPENRAFSRSSLTRNIERACEEHAAKKPVALEPSTADMRDDDQKSVIQAVIDGTEQITRKAMDAILVDIASQFASSES